MVIKRPDDVIDGSHILCLSVMKDMSVFNKGDVFKVTDHPDNVYDVILESDGDYQTIRRVTLYTYSKFFCCDSLEDKELFTYKMTGVLPKRILGMIRLLILQSLISYQVI